MRNMPAVLVVEDEPAIAELIAVNLRHNGFRTTWAIDSASAQVEIDASVPDLILLDWMLPGESGLVLAKRPELTQFFGHFHGGVIAEICRQATASRPFAFVHADNCSISRVVVFADGRRMLRSFNDTNHLG